MLFEVNLEVSFRLWRCLSLLQLELKFHDSVLEPDVSDLAVELGQAVCVVDSKPKPYSSVFHQYLNVFPELMKNGRKCVEVVGLASLVYCFLEGIQLNLAYQQQPCGVHLHFRLGLPQSLVISLQLIDQSLQRRISCHVVKAKFPNLFFELPDLFLMSCFRIAFQVLQAVELGIFLPHRLVEYQYSLSELFEPALSLLHGVLPHFLLLFQI
mmetsp:Transcript_34759/g.61179  ORF Transcript_34759/g.61179 Transcript_34759/m.61179 type:complete len:211 (+) Transcript_34759:3866-4498(+)